MASLALSPSVPLRPLADQPAGLAVVGGEGGVGGVHRIERRVEHDDHQAGVARLLDGRHDRLGVARHDGEALGAGRDQVLDAGDLAVIVAVVLAGGRSCSSMPSSLAFASAPSRILTKNGLVSVLVIRPTMSAAEPARRRQGRERNRAGRTAEIILVLCALFLPGMSPPPADGRAVRLLTGRRASRVARGLTGRLPRADTNAYQATPVNKLIQLIY